MTDTLRQIKKQIIEALQHPEAEDGLYLNNLLIVHEEEERPIVVGEEQDVIKALREMVASGEISVAGEGETAVYTIVLKA
jgi:hypothetical protein